MSLRLLHMNSYCREVLPKNPDVHGRDEDAQETMYAYYMQKARL